MKSKDELTAIREAQKRNAWINNVKKVYGYTQEQAEREWAKIFHKPKGV